MSNKFEVSKLDYLDDRTKAIINGYIRDQTTKLKISHIPDELNVLTLFYVDDHFMMYRGSYQWNITDPQKLESILTAQQDQFFTSDIFEICKLKWLIKIYPAGYNGNPSTNGFAVFVEILSMPKAWDYIIIQQSIICKEVDTVFHYIQTYNAGTCMYKMHVCFVLITTKPIYYIQTRDGIRMLYHWQI